MAGLLTILYKTIAITIAILREKTIEIAIPVPAFKCIAIPIPIRLGIPDRQLLNSHVLHQSA
jgi:hypothetical protein